ncbi:hypothetical protein AHMF7605_17905 [Adhaeribacter arboris]|uniref:Uncharacterized protein n=1 Tax=Adhaeribacter arboris TaxID=2072846 RepID=A0A2T2YIA0_9BACT|nr:hypothetical protein [Adhaeribacter arboris]PSR55246.1 hypothetical protein AHMF7605_17905 [Adhaeribacter arboris]
MIEKHFISPWGFGNNDKQMFSPDKQNRIEYFDLIEFVMGSPLAGECYWVDRNSKMYLINKLCAGPPIWNTEGNKVALPVWKRTLLKGTIQKLTIVDIIKNELTLYKKIFRVLDLKTFDKNLVTGIDSPIHNPIAFQFDLNQEEVEKTKRI